MTTPRVLEGIPSPLWRRIESATHRLLMLDYDGTLAPFRTERDQALPLPRAIEQLRAIAGGIHTSVAIVSGRPLAELDRLLGTVRATLVGEHGWECREPDGRIVQRPLDPAVASALERADRFARAQGWGESIERKRTSVVLHTRAFDAAHARALEERCLAGWSALARPAEMVLERMDGGVELRARGRNKGTAVLSLISHAPQGALGVFVGDDVSDEDAFEVVAEWGFGIRVGTGSLPSRAQARLASPEQVADFLEAWREMDARRA